MLRKLKEAAETHLGHAVRRAVLTVPAYFSSAQRQATLDAARLAGLATEWEVVDPESGKTCRQRMRLLHEPTAAALAHGRGQARNARVAVIHLGGGTFDVSVLDTGEGVFQVEAVGGDTCLGGDDFDDRVVSYREGEQERLIRAQFGARAPGPI